MLHIFITNVDTNCEYSSAGCIDTWPQHITTNVARTSLTTSSDKVPRYNQRPGTSRTVSCNCPTSLIVRIELTYCWTVRINVNPILTLFYMWISIAIRSILFQCGENNKQYCYDLILIKTELFITKFVWSFSKHLFCKAWKPLSLNR